MLIFDHYFTSKSFPAVREVYTNVYPDKDVPNKATIVHTTGNNISGHSKCLRQETCSSDIVDRCDAPQR
jgi:hypothetical protein